MWLCPNLLSEREPGLEQDLDSNPDPWPSAALVVKPDFVSDSGRLLLTTLGTSLARDGDLRLHCLSG